MATEVPDPEPGPGEVLIEIAATAVNRADLVQRVGNYPPPEGASEILGLEAAGTIVEVGPGVDGLAPGQRVMALLAGGGYAERVAVPAGQVLPVPEGMSFTDAAAIPEVFLTAWMALSTRAGLGVGEHLLIHAAASGVGTAAVQVGKALGAEVIAASRDIDRLDIAVELGAGHAISSADGEFAAAVKKIVPGGADVILDLVGPGWWAENVSALAVGGRLVMLSLITGAKADVDFSRLLPRQATFHGAGLRLLDLTRKAAIVHDFGEWGLPRFATGELRPIIDRILPLTEAGMAHALLEKEPITGKIILEVAG